ncbi:serine hydrolase [Nonomuraea maritima]|uniref:serine hydrolase n=1 Tax=Nonomuraea maritima TaxID=683260 RepID=UPI00371782D5
MNAPSKPVRLLAAASVAITMSACVSAPVTAQASPAAAVVGPAIPDSPAGRQLTWILDAVNRTPVPESELKEHFTADFLTNIPPDQINQALAMYAGLRMERIVRNEENSLVARSTVGGVRYDVALSVDGAGLIEGLLFQAVAPGSWDEIDERLTRIAPQTGFLAAELTGDGRCRPVHEVAAEKSRPLGSMIKLYVLGALAEAVKNGRLSWDTELTITPEPKSLPVGELGGRPDNSKVSVLEAAKLMISISDNTATDLIIHAVGRKAVERTMREWGARDKRNVPLLTTRDLVVLKGADYPRHADRYLRMNDAKQRDYLRRVVAEVPLSQVTLWQEPRALNTVEWFASPTEICRAYAGLVKLGDARIHEVMSINDAGLGLDRTAWPRVWFKGGSEPGLAAMSFLARNASGKSYVVVGVSADPKGSITGLEQLQQPAVARAAFTLAARAE